jgi:hypothetical protein
MLIMGDEAATSDSSTSLLLRIDGLCDQFEAALQVGAAHRIEDYLGLMTTDCERSALLTELVLLEIDYRRRCREKFDIFEYARRFPSEKLDPILGTIDTGFPRGVQPTKTAPAAARTKVILSVVAGPSQGQSFSFDRHDTLVVGRSPLAHLKLPRTDKFLSRVHFQIEVDPPSCRLTNTSSTNGTFVNGQQVSVADLKDGDIILAGNTAIRVLIKGTSPEAG